MREQGLKELSSLNEDYLVTLITIIITKVLKGRIGYGLLLEDISPEIEKPIRRSWLIIGLLKDHFRSSGDFISVHLIPISILVTNFAIENN